MNHNLIFEIFKEIEISINNEKEIIEKLDQEIGDGDHIFNLQRGLKECLVAEDELKNCDIPEIFKKLGLKIMTNVGGSSGALYSTLLLNMSKNFEPRLDDKNNLIEMFYAGVVAMKKIGKSDLGEKTMLDVLIPVSIILKDNKHYNSSKLSELSKEAAYRGMLATKDLIATKGRASYLGERSKGHIDPGAKSSQVAINAICDFILNYNKEKI